MNKTNVLVILGTSHKNAKSELITSEVMRIVNSRDEAEAKLADPKAFNMPNDGHDDEDRDDNYRKITEWADAFFIVTPEYNHSFPGSLKRMLDMEFNNYFKKPVTIAGVSNGQFGGARAIESLIPVVHRLGMVISSVEVPVPNASDQLDESGRLTSEFIEGNINKALDDILLLSKALKWAAAQN